MRRKLVWIEEPHFGGFGCSACGWRFKLPEEPTGVSLDAMIEIIELRRDKEFISHVCGDFSKQTMES
jgi:hypothetical protein